MENRNFYKLAAIAAMTTALTTFLLWFLPKLYTPPENFDEGVLLATNFYYLLRQWVNLVHIPLALLAYFGLAYKLRKRELPRVGMGMIWFGIWGAIEMIGIATIIFAVNKSWRSSYASFNDAAKEI